MKLEDVVREDQESLRGIVGKVKVEVGYKTYAKGIAPEDSFFAFRDEAERKKAKELARVMAEESGERYTKAVQIRVYRDTAVVQGQAAAERWRGDRLFTYPTYSDAFRKVILPDLQRVGIPELPWEGWARLVFVPDPYFVAQGDAGKVEQDTDGEVRFPTVATIQEVFESEDAARATISAANGAGNGKKAESAKIDTSQALPREFPDGYDFESWAVVREEIKKARREGRTIGEIAEMYGVSPAWVVKA